MATAESRATTINRLRESLQRIAPFATRPQALAEEPEYLELVALFKDDHTPFEEVLDYALGTAWVTSAAALQALVHRPEAPTAVDEILGRLSRLDLLALSPALQLIATYGPPERAGRVLVQLADESRFPTHELPLRVVTCAVDDYLAALSQRREPLSFGPGLDDVSPRDFEGLKQTLQRSTQPAAAVLLKAVSEEDAARLTQQQAAAAATPPTDATPPPAPPPSEPGFFDKVGRFWSDADVREPIAPPAWTDALEAATRTLSDRPLRSVLVVGHPLAGKSAFLKLFGRKIRANGWKVFEAGANDFLADNIYIGQTEGLVRQATKELAAEKRIVWYVPDLLGLAQSGAHRHNSATILDQILPAVASGQVVIWGEADPPAAERLLRLRPALRRSLEVVRLEPLTARETVPLARDVAERLAEARGVTIEPSLATAAVDAASRYFTASSLPGSALALLRDTMSRSHRAKGSTVTEHDLLDSLAHTTGLPQSLLNGSERIDLAALTAFFSSRVIGQPDAVRCVVERIAMLKAGLNDPAKPLGVFLFAGPTGTGKTELAKTIAEYLFGSAERLVRLDMSEFRAPESAAKIIGGSFHPEQADTLIDRIRRQPFSVLLFDEFEKSHWEIWDLCLQLLDEGRLTDHKGHTADFRNCLIILTTNLGATSHQTSGLGFGQAQATFATDQVLRAIGDVFRPEFQNRLDNVVVFRPLTRELMRGILTKELGRLYERRGLKERDWAIEWEASAIEFLLEKGFNADMGARPLKRAIDQYVAVPLATAIVERRASDREQFVFMRSDGTGIQAEFIDPDGEPTRPARASAPPAAAQAPASLRDIALSPRGHEAEVHALAAAQQMIAARVTDPAWLARKADLLDAINATDFWQRADRFEVLSQYELLDRLAVAAETAESLSRRLVRPGRPANASTRAVIGRLAAQLLLVEDGIRDVEEEAPVEVMLTIEPAADGHAADTIAVRAWRDELLGMYTAWAGKRNMQCTTLGASSTEASSVLLVSGFGAHRTLAHESGLHVLEQPGAGTAGAGTGPRIAARVIVAPSPLDASREASGQRAVLDAVAQAPRVNTIVRRYRKGPSPLVRGLGGSRTGKLAAVLAGDFDVLLPNGR